MQKNIIFAPYKLYIVLKSKISGKKKLNWNWDDFYFYFYFLRGGIEMVLDIPKSLIFQSKNYEIFLATFNPKILIMSKIFSNFTTWQNIEPYSFMLLVTQNFGDNFTSNIVMQPLLLYMIEGLWFTVCGIISLNLLF